MDIRVAIGKSLRHQSAKIPKKWQKVPDISFVLLRGVICTTLCSMDNGERCRRKVNFQFTFYTVESDGVEKQMAGGGQPGSLE